MNYLIVCESNNQHYLLMTKPEGEVPSSIQAYNSKESVMKAFKGYTEAWTRDVTWSASACLGMMNMNPVAIEAVDIEVIKPFITKMNLVHVQGGAMLRGYYGLEVSKDILQFKQFSIWSETMVEAGIKS